jgi:uncharacterized membrane protein
MEQPLQQQQDSEFYPLPQPEELSIREKEDAMGAYLMMFAALGAGLPLPIINLIAAIIYYYVNKSSSRFVRFHSLQALISQLPTTLMNAVALGWGIRIIFFGWQFTDVYKGYLCMTLLADLLYFIWGIIGAIKARKGHFYYFILFGKIAYMNVYRIRPEDNKGPVVNTPPKL